MRLCIIGLGGIGSRLANSLSQFISYDINDKCEMILVDGDQYEEKNLNRQVFEYDEDQEFNNKAETKYKELSTKYKNIQFDYFPNS